MANNTPPGEGGDDLAEFRNQWKKELTVKTGDAAGDNLQEAANRDDGQDQDDDVHRKARDFFMQGVEFEQSGLLYEAIRFYKKAEKLVPNIEHYAHKFNGGKCVKSKDNPVAANANVDDNGNMSQDIHNEEDFEIDNLCSKFAKLRTSGQCCIKKEVQTNMTHIGELPSEVINHIVKWVVSSDMDLRSLETLAAVCRGLYIAARDEEVWRLICVRMWGPGLLSQKPVCPSWRDLFLSKPRVHFNGCYVSKMKYLREGERGFQDQETYRAWHIVEYNRYLRFFPGGQVIMALSSDDEAIIAKQLNTKTGGLNIPGAIMGRYRIAEDVIVCVLHKPRAAPKKTQKYKRKGRKEIDNSYEVPEQDFHLEFFMSGHKWGRLEWKHFDLVSKYTSGKENVDNFQIRDQNKYPSVVFKHVSSYQFESSFPLA